MFLFKSLINQEMIFMNPKAIRIYEINKPIKAIVTLITIMFCSLDYNSSNEILL